MGWEEGENKSVNEWRALIPGGTTDLGEREHDAPHLALVLETIFADNFQLRVAVARLEDLRRKQRPARAQWPGCVLTDGLIRMLRGC